MISFTKALAGAILALLFEEDPSLKNKPETMAEWKPAIAELAEYHVEVGARGRLVSPHIDALLLATVNYAESRFQLPAPGGDCYWTHEFYGVPSLRWPPGYEPKLRRVCPAVGPMQIAHGNVRVVPTWSQVQALFPGRDWDDERLTRDELKESKPNVTIAYGILWHLKDECRHRAEPASAASWLTAYRWGRCTPQHHTKRYFDGEAKLRCERLDKMKRHITEAGVAIEAPQTWDCTKRLPRPAGTS